MQVSIRVCNEFVSKFNKKYSRNIKCFQPICGQPNTSESINIQLPIVKQLFILNNKCHMYFL